MKTLITFISDFSSKDWFVAAVKGEILKINREALIIDITHDVEPHNIRSAAFILHAVYRNFPAGTVHLAVVDPGVGTERKPLVIESDGYCFVGPDNGLFTMICGQGAIVYELRTAGKVSSTFHARDLFGPSAALLSLGQRPEQISDRIKDIARITVPQCIIRDTAVSGAVMYVDHFGNLITNIPNDIEIDQFTLGNRKVPVISSYAQGKKGQLSAIRGSIGYYEITSNQGNACKISNAEPDYPVNGQISSVRK